MTKELYRDLYFLIEKGIDNAKHNIESATDIICDLSDVQNDIAFKQAVKTIKKNKEEQKRLEKLLDKFETEVQEP